MVARGHLEVKVAVPCNAEKKAIPADGIFHEKAGIIEDRDGDKIAWNGSLNETAAGWRDNWESINVYTSWGPQPRRVAAEETNFARIWNNKTQPRDRARCARRRAPRSDAVHANERPKPARLKEEPEKKVCEAFSGKAGDRDEGPRKTSQRLQHGDLRKPRLVFHPACTFISTDGGERVGEMTAAVTPWPHQVRAFERLYHTIGPPSC